MNMQTDKELFDFLSNAPKEFTENEKIKKFQLKNGDFIHCVLWNMHFYITGTDIVKILVWRFQNAGRQIVSLKKFEEGVFSDLRNLKPGIDATLEGPRSDFLEFLYKNGCIRTQKKQKVFFWYSVPHDALFCDALERDLRRETNLYAYSKYYNKQMYAPMPPQFTKQFQTYAESMAWQPSAPASHLKPKSMQTIVNHPNSALNYNMGIKGVKPFGVFNGSPHTDSNLTQSTPVSADISPAEQPNPNIMSPTLSQADVLRMRQSTRPMNTAPHPPFKNLDFVHWEEKYFDTQVQMPGFMTRDEKKTDEFVDPDMIIPNKKSKNEKPL